MLPLLLLALGAATARTPTCPDTSDVGRFLSEFLADLPSGQRIPRGAFVLVCGDHQVYATGFGKTQGGTPVDPDRTLFRAASNSKLVTATAAMQLAASGRWKLTDEVNRYLPPAARLADEYGRQVTIADLLDHTAGFEDKFAGGIALESDRISLAKFFERNRPKRVRPAGAEVSYSNIGIALAGYAVEVASGESFDAYAMNHIFLPLGMTHSTYAQPVPIDWRRDLASGPPRNGRGLVFLPYPAASLVTTPADMGRFIAAHLSNGATGAGRIIPPDAIAVMHASHWRPQQSVPGVAYGFFEGEMNGRRTLFHTGDSGDHSVVFLLPELGVGFYFVYTGSDEQAAVREKLTRTLMDRYFPNAGTQRPFNASQNVAELAGRYRGAAYSHSNYEKLKAMFYQVIIRDGRDGALRVSPPGSGDPIRFRPRARYVFDGDSGEVIAFRKDASGRVAGFTLSGSIWDPQSFDRISILEDGRLHSAAFVAVIVAFLVRLLYSPINAIMRRIRRKPRATYSATERNWWRWSGIVSALTLITPIIGIGVAFLSFRPGAVAIPRAALVVGVWLTLVVLAGLLLVPGTVLAWRGRFWSTTRRIVFTFVAVAFLLGGPLLAYWRVLPF